MLAFGSEVLAWIVLVAGYGIGVRRTPAWVKVSLAFAILSLVGVVVTIPTLATVVAVAIQRIESLFSGEDLTAAARLETILNVVAVSTDSFLNFLLGIGFGNLPAILGEHSATTGNIFADIVTETGLVGLCSFVGVVLAALILPLRSLTLFVKARDEEMLAVFFGAYVSVVGLLVGGMTYATHMLNFFWFACGLLFALHRHRMVTVRWSSRQKLRD